MDIYRIRRENLRKLIDLKFDGVAGRLAEKIGRQPSYIYRVFTENEQHVRNIGEDLARKIEKIVGFESGWLDLIHTNEGKKTALPQGAKKDTSTPQTLNAELIEKIIEAVENRLAETKTKLPPKIKASAITMLYEHFSQVKAVDLATVRVLLKGIIKTSKETSTATNNH